MGFIDNVIRKWERTSRSDIIIQCIIISVLFIGAMLMDNIMASTVLPGIVIGLLILAGIGITLFNQHEKKKTALFNDDIDAIVKEVQDKRKERISINIDEVIKQIKGEK